jgi:cobalt-zinc-cadmium efflux system protein
VAVRTLEYPLPELDCEDCAAELHKRLMNDAGVHKVTVDAQTKLVKVDVDEGDYAAKALRSRIGSLLDGEMQAIAHHRRLDSGSNGSTAPRTPTPAGVGTEAVQAVDGSHQSLPTLAVVGGEMARRDEPDQVHADHVGQGHGDHDHAGHDHRQEFREQAATRSRRLLAVVLVGALVIVGELAAAYASNSLALMADAAHATTDLAAVALALLATHWVTKQATKAKTWGYHRAEIVAAFVNAILLWGVSAYFILEAIDRFRNPPEVVGPLVIAAGLLTLVANLVFARLLHTPHGGNINMRAAYLHVLSDALGSLAALLSGLAIYQFGWLIADPLLTVFITLLIVVFTWRLTKQTLHILMEGAPAHADPHDVTKALKDVPGVQDVHDLHVWTLTSGVDSVSAHVVTSKPEATDRVVHAVQDVLKSQFKIDHVTVQVEDPSCPCTGARHQWHAP